MKMTDSDIGRLPDRTVILAGDAAKRSGSDYYTTMKVLNVFHSLLIGYLCRNFEVRLFSFMKLFLDCRICAKKDKERGYIVHPYYPERYFFTSIFFNRNIYYKVDLTEQSASRVRHAIFCGIRYGSEKELTHKIVRHHDVRTFELGNCSRIGRDGRRRSRSSRLSHKKVEMAN
jgi:hypothetical protein